MKENSDFADLKYSAQSHSSGSKKFDPPSFTPDELRQHISAMSPKHVVYRTFRARELNMLYGRSNAGKSTLLLDLACSALERDQTVLGQYATLPGDEPKVAWISGEHDLEDIRDKLGEWSAPRGELRFYDLSNRIDLGSPQKWVIEIIKKSDLVIIDTVMSTMKFSVNNRPVSMRDGAFWGALANTFKPALQQHNTALILSHHSPKGGDTAGTPYGDLAENYMDQIIRVEKAAGKEVEDGGKYEGAQFFIESYKQRGSKPFPKTFGRFARENREARLRVRKVDAKK